MRPDATTPDLILDGVGYRLEHPAELAAWLLLRPYRGIQFPHLVHTRARLTTAVSPAAGRPQRPGLSPQLRFGWDAGQQKEDTSCHIV